jgi:hypothetical protein
MPHLDLASKYAVSFSLHVDLPNSNEVFNRAFKELQGSGRRLFFASLYSRKKSKVALVIRISPLDKERGYHLVIEYGSNDGIPTLPRKIPSVQRAFELLDAFKDPFEFNVFAQFVYPKERFQSSVGIPIKFASLDESTFDEVRGFRLIKHQGDNKVKYGIIIDLPPGESLQHSLNYLHTGKIGEGTFQDALNCGVTISEKFIRPSPSKTKV